MAHPFAKYNEQDAGKARAKAFTKKAGGGPVTVATDDTKDYPSGMQADRAARIASTRRADMEPAGRKAGGRLDKFARGGRAKHKGNNTKINIVVAPKGPHPADGAAPPAPLGPPPMGGGLPPMAGPPPGMPPGLGGPKPPGMMARGGVVKRASGGAVNKLAKMVKQPTAGSLTGKGRLQLDRIQKKIG